MSLADYLAKKYLTADGPAEKKKSKKRKRKEAEASGGLVIADDDATDWNSGPQTNDDDEAPMNVAGTSAEFRKKKTSGWKTVGSSAPTNADQAAADAIIASAAAENRASGAADDEAPTVADNQDGPVMDSGAAAGLQTASQVAAALEKRQREERKHMEAAMREAGAAAGETIYRDASGRIINVAMKRAEARRAANEAEAKKRQEEEEAKGDVQRAEKEARRQALAEAKYMPFARTADDKEINEEMKEVERWNDPAMQFLTTKKEKKSRTGKPLYKGAFEPNRYGIRPGHRWDGVDRSNGFEREWFKSRNARANRRDLEYAWQMDE
ncbi:Pre-mRNA-splicing factor cwc26 [Phyllosticta citribraziliensis]|uniref:Pre-mRNA-splicing factor cwc26 n=1 Tax=Phyllosticta citribraziliensis TaxID=989973 RepID=A0ABR1LHT1_9PEZI